MKNNLSFTNRGKVYNHLTFAAILTCLLRAHNLCAAPRSPLPPVPEHQPIFHESFDENFFEGQTNAQLAIPGFGFLDESWSGYALDRTGETVAPFLIPALDATGHTNIACDTGGALRCWINPSWSSQSVLNGTGPGTNAVILEFDAVSGEENAIAWSLQTSADGNTLNLIAQTSTGIQTVIQSPISWQAGQSHCLALDFNQNATALYMDGVLTTQGGGLPLIPLSVGQLAIGSAYSGANPAGGSIEEFYSFDALLSDFDVAAYEQFTAATAALGPISDAEQVSGPQRRTTMESIYTPGNVYDPQNATPCSPGGAFYITNLTSTLQTNGMATVAFDIYGGTNGVFYDIFSTPNLNYSLRNYQWNWIGQGLTCNSYTFTNQPPGQAFYTLELSGQTFTVAFDGNNSYGQLATPSGLSNAVAIAAGGYFSLAMLNNGTVIGWGDNSWGELDIPSGLTNVIGIAGGYLHGVALLANGSVTNWGYYYDGGSYVTSVSDTTYASQPPTSDVMAIAAGMGQDLALMSNGTVVAWGFTNVYGTGAAFGTTVPSGLNLTNVAAIACGWQFNLALSSNGTVTAWGNDDASLGYDLTNVPPDLMTNVAAIAAGGLNSLALRKDGTVEGWGYSGAGVTNVPSGLSNVVAVATGGEDGIALQGNGNIVIWGNPSLTNIPVGMAGVKAISAGYDHNVVLESGILTPIIFTQPQNQYAPAHSNATFSALGEGVAGVSYQWQFNGVNITGATNATLTLTNVGATNNGSYDVIVSTSALSLTSSVATFTLVVAPQLSPSPSVGVTWINEPMALAPNPTNPDQADYPMTYTWQLNGTNLGTSFSTYSFNNPVLTNEGAYTVGVTNIVAGTNVTWDIRLAYPGMVEAWGDDDSYESDRPGSYSNITAIAAGEYQSVAVTDSGTVLQWGEYSDGTSYYSVTNTTVASQPPTSGIVAVAAGLGQGLALTISNTLTAWGLSGAYGTSVPSQLNLTNVKAIACGWQFDVALRNDGTVTAWGYNAPSLGYTLTNVPPSLANVTAIAAGPLHTLALQSAGTVVAWGYNTVAGETNVPANATNVAAIAAGLSHNLVLQSNGTIVAWGDNTYGQCTIPAAASQSNVIAIAAGDNHSVALLTDGSLVEWGDNSSGQATVPSESITTRASGAPGITITNDPFIVKLIAAGGDHTMAAIWSPLVQYPVDPSKDLLLIYNTNSLDSYNVCQYYLNHRPMVQNANVFGVDCTNGEQFSASQCAAFMAQITNWFTTNQTKRPSYVILFPNIPSRVDVDIGEPSVQYQLHYSTLANWSPFVTAINMNGTGGTNDCIAYINKLALFGAGNFPGHVVISASSGGYGNTNWYLDDTATANYAPSITFYPAIAAISNAVPNAQITYINYTSDPSLDGTFAGHITTASNVAGYGSWGAHGYYDDPTGSYSTNYSYATNGTIQFQGQSDWYLIETVESFNGDRVVDQGNILAWYASNAFGGTAYTNTPAGAVSYVDEPGVTGVNDSSIYFGFWASGESFASCAWASVLTSYFQAVGDPLVKK